MTTDKVIIVQQDVNEAYLKMENMQIDIFSYAPAGDVVYSKVNIRLQNLSHSAYEDVGLQYPLHIKARITSLPEQIQGNLTEFDLFVSHGFKASGEVLTIPNVTLKTFERFHIWVDGYGMSPFDTKKIKLKLRAEIIETF